MKEVGAFERIISVTIDADALEKAKGRAARKLSGEMKIKGFRPGKAPRRVVESMVGSETLKKEAIEEALPGAVGEALAATDLEPVTSPRVEEMRDVDDGVEVDVLITLWPVLEHIPDYEGRRIHVHAEEVSDEDVEAQLERMRTQFAELDDVSREAFDGDFALIDVRTSHGGEELGAGSASDMLYEIGSEAFLQGMDEALRGKGAGHIAQFDTTLPAGIGEEAGSEVTVRILVKQVKTRRLPELTDEWVDDVSEFDTVDELRVSLREQLGLIRLSAVRNELEQHALEQLREEMDLELPPALVESEMDAALHRFAHRLGAEGMGVDDFLAQADREAFVADLRKQAESNLGGRVLLEAIIREEGLEVADEEVEATKAALLTGATQMSQRDPNFDLEGYRASLEEEGQEEALAGDILRRKAVDRLLEGMVATDAEGNEIPLPRPDGDSPDSGDEATAGENKPTVSAEVDEE